VLNISSNISVVL